MLGSKLVVSCAVLVGSFAYASDPLSWADLKKSDQLLGVISATLKQPKTNFTIRPSMAKYVWVARTRDGAGVAINDAGNIMMAGSKVLDLNNRKVLDSADVMMLKKAVVRNIDQSALIEQKFGSGKGRRYLIWSAVDCPACSSLERITPNLLGETDSMVQIIPTSLRPEADGMVESIWCASNNSLAWSEWQKSKTLPKSRKLGCNLKAGMSEDLGVVLASLGWRLYGTPSIISENGSLDNFLRVGKLYGDSFYAGDSMTWLLKNGFSKVVRQPELINNTGAGRKTAPPDNKPTGFTFKG